MIVITHETSQRKKFIFYLYLLNLSTSCFVHKQRLQKRGRCLQCNLKVNQNVLCCIILVVTRGRQVVGVKNVVFLTHIG